MSHRELGDSRIANTTPLCIRSSRSSGVSSFSGRYCRDVSAHKLRPLVCSLKQHLIHITCHIYTPAFRYTRPTSGDPFRPTSALLVSLLDQIGFNRVAHTARQELSLPSAPRHNTGKFRTSVWDLPALISIIIVSSRNYRTTSTCYGWYDPAGMH
ncbi:hypothetical protein SCLCIDRAFT_1048973 [Scleroderma citrinum Foug A]|uniref:Uncharacterized protein n=1 Tax=Scleroderma citrinum Foug A TaxID=1036808 RepID=A0A0C3A2H2_9AGAM|nr:hypothetical protein SCLCIDRAFT_1048973 [Scleroderma citrinum Foug A]